MAEKYSQKFEQFWQAYPRKTAKAVAWRSWQKHVDEADAFMVQAIIDNLEKRTRLKWWAADKSKVPHAATWINQGRYLDEGWEDDVKTRGREDGYVERKYVSPEDTGPDLTMWEKMLNRLARDYLRCSGGLSTERLKQMISIKKETLKDLLPAINEEIVASEGDKKVRHDMAVLLADTMLSRFDIDLGLSLKHRVLKGSAQ